LVAEKLGMPDVNFGLSTFEEAISNDIIQSLSFTNFCEMEMDGDGS
jgi:hypothetical protein